MQQKAVFLDKDGTLINDVPYNVDPALITLAHGAGAGLRMLQELGYKLIVVSNQSGVAQGHFPEDALDAVWQRLDDLLAREDVSIDGYYYCPHHSEGTMPGYTQDCNCRKPLPGLLLHGAEDHSIDLEASWMVGDILNDVEAGKRAGCQAILIDNGNETEWEMSDVRMPDATVSNLYEAALVVAQYQLALKHHINPLLVQATL